MEKIKKDYYLGLDIGTDSVGYAAADTNYALLKYRGEPMWGATTFEAATDSADRRAFRISRRRYDRRQQRVKLVEEIFAPEVAKVDERFFLRLEASRLFRDEAGEPYALFNDKGYTDKDYYRDYPTIHHLICELMSSTEPHDVRLVFLACSWLVAHRGHFLSDTPLDSVGDLLDFDRVYVSFLNWLNENGFAHPWDDEVTAAQVQNVLSRKLGVTRKTELFKAEILGGKKPSKELAEDTPFTQEGVIKLLSGAKVALADLFRNPEYKELDPPSVSLNDPDEEFAAILNSLGDDGELLRKLRDLNDCALLAAAQGGKATVSEAKAAVYDQHKSDLLWLKGFVKKYIPEKYDEIFLEAGKPNYVAYSYNTRSVKGEVKKVGKADFCDWLRKLISRDISVLPEDQTAYDDAISRLTAYTFLPKQKDTDNRVIPYQLYYVELDAILRNAEGYLPFLSQKDKSGLSDSDKLRSILTFRIPYYVGPLNTVGSKNAWIVRKADGKIYPWNFEEKVDLDGSERAFIDRMTNSCTYLPGETVLPKNSLLYCEFTILNELNNIRIDNVPIPAKAKLGIFEELFKIRPRVTVKAIRDWLISNGFAEKTSELTGLDTAIKSSYKPYLSFRRLLGSGQLTVDDAEEIIRQMAYTEEKSRMRKWLSAHYPQLSEEDLRYIANLGFKDFGRLSRRFLTGLMGTEYGTGEAMTIMEALRSRSENLMQLLSDRYDYSDRIKEEQQRYYAGREYGMEERLTELRVSGAVKRPIYRTLDIVEDVVRAAGCAPKKIFVEMARGGTEDQRGKRTRSRRDQIMDLYKTAETDTAALEKELEAMGESAENRLQSDKLFLYFIQLGKCMYTGESIDLAQLGSRLYDIDHIYPQAAVKDDSILNNKVLVTSEANGKKSDSYPISADIRAKMRGFWDILRESKLITDEKYRRLIRTTPFTEEERWGFINRQLVETRQSTKVIAELLQERFGEGTEIVYAKAGLVSDFRHEFGLLKSRTVNDLHHAKDAYLNIVVGNVYHMKFSRRWFAPAQSYSMNTRPLFTHPVLCGREIVWNGEEDLARVKAVMAKNNAHLTRFAFCRKGGLFDQNPVKAGAGLVPLKADLPTEKYGGYNKATASFYLLASYTIKKKKDVMFVPVELLHAERVRNDREYAREYIAGMISQINGGKPVDNVSLCLNGRPIKINTVLELDGMRVTISGKDSGGKRVLIRALMALSLSREQELYVKRLESVTEKLGYNSGLVLDTFRDGVSQEQNLALYDALQRKMSDTVYAHCPGNFAEALKKGRNAFAALSLTEQASLLLRVVAWFGGTAGGCDIVAIGGSKASGVKVQSSKLSNMAKNWKDIRIIDVSASGIYETRSGNLLELL